MRFGLVVDSLDAGDSLADLVARAQAAEDAGFDLVWLPESAAVPAPAVAAAALAPHVSSIRVGIEVAAGVNPVYLAEEAAVADLCLGGRLVLAVRSEDAGLLGETVDALLAGTAARPFRHEGERWQIPANLPANEVNREERVRVTPATAQLELPVWVSGPPAAQVARERCLTFVGARTDPPDVMVTAWQLTEARLGPAAKRLRRAAVRAVAVETDGAVDDETLVAALREEQRAWGLDIALVALPAGSPAFTLNDIAARVVPRVQLDRLPAGLEQYWKQRQERAL